MLESCLGLELMTSALTNGVDNPLSRITVATLDDLGYTVDYSSADAYDASHIDPSCICNRRERSLQEYEAMQPQQQQQQQRLRNLVEPEQTAARLNAIEIGMNLLKSRSNTVIARLAVRGEAVSNSISVFYRDEDGSIRDVIVSV